MRARSNIREPVHNLIRLTDRIRLAAIQFHLGVPLHGLRGELIWLGSTQWVRRCSTRA